MTFLLPPITTSRKLAAQKQQEYMDYHPAGKGHSTLRICCMPMADG
jgi:hypothetical protein